MQPESFCKHRCAIAGSLERVGDRWSILILRECFYGVTHFDDFQKQLGIAPNMLTRRLKTLVQEGLMERRQYSERPPRFEYLLTERGRDFRPVLLTLLVWGNRHFAPDGVKMQLVDSTTGKLVEPVLINRLNGASMDQHNRLLVRAVDDSAAPFATDINPPSQPTPGSPTYSSTHFFKEN